MPTGPASGGCSLTWDGVVQDKAQESTDKHARGQEHLDDLVQLENPWNETKAAVHGDQGPPSFTPIAVTVQGRQDSPVCNFSGFSFTQLGMASPQ